MMYGIQGVPIQGIHGIQCVPIKMEPNSRDANPPDFIGRLPKIHPNSRPYDHPPNPPEITIFSQ